MVKTPLGMGLLLLTLAWPLWAWCAPLDEFLTAQPGYAPGHGEIEVGWDMMNKTVDLFGVREPDSRGEDIGDYTGGHIRGGLALTKRLWIDGGLWKRGVKTPYDDGESIGWQLGSQLQMTYHMGWLPALALRLSYWGNRANEANKGSATNVASLTVDTIRVDNPKDHQTQVDLIATWALSEKSLMTLFAGGGRSKTDFDRLSLSLGGCEYSLDESPNNDSDYAYLAPNDSRNCVGFGFSESFHPAMFLRYDSKYWQMGGHYQWMNDKWRARLGYRFIKVDRDELDALVTQYGKTGVTYDSNHILTAELGYKITPSIGGFVRSQLMKRQFVGELPLTYNPFSAHKFEEPYGILTLGLTSGF
ncbi:MAG: hypothetical protein HQL52_09380 [Magnetococcales bacterium]|nr:hypothetical protein [Magnetococcales bacterium]